MDFKVFDTTKIDEYSKRAKEQWGQNSEYKEFEEKTKNWTKDDEATVANGFMQLFVEFGQMKEMDPADETEFEPEAPASVTCFSMNFTRWSSEE